MTTQKCIICDHRPASTDKGYCHNCTAKIEAGERQNGNSQPKYYLTYRGTVVGLYPNGNGKLKAQLLRRSPEGLPKGITIDINHYCEGFDRSQIKAFKRCVLSLSNA